MGSFAELYQLEATIAVDLKKKLDSQKDSQDECESLKSPIDNAGSERWMQYAHLRRIAGRELVEGSRFHCWLHQQWQWAGQ